MSTPSSDIDELVRSALAASDAQRAATVALDAYGSEILSFLGARLRSQSDGAEAFSMFAEDFWRGLPRFAFRCNLRTWMYTIARNAANRYAVSPQHKRGRNLTLTGNAPLSQLIEQARSATAIHMRTDVKDRMRALREQLDVEDQTLLILHIDRALPWRDLALVMQGEGEPLEGEALDREAARLRKRFERVKAQLKELAIQDGLVKG
jgi:RNA polymerase sigma-70 factor (ECF subfamily)